MRAPCPHIVTPHLSHCRSEDCHTVTLSYHHLSHCHTEYCHTLAQGQPENILTCHTALFSVKSLIYSNTKYILVFHEK